MYYYFYFKYYLLLLKFIFYNIFNINYLPNDYMFKLNNDNLNLNFFNKDKLIIFKSYKFNLLYFLFRIGYLKLLNIENIIKTEGLRLSEIND